MSKTPADELDERADRIRRDAADRSGHQRVVAWDELPEQLRERWRRAAGAKGKQPPTGSR